MTPLFEQLVGCLLGLERIQNGLEDVESGFRVEVGNVLQVPQQVLEYFAVSQQSLDSGRTHRRYFHDEFDSLTEALQVGSFLDAVQCVEQHRNALEYALSDQADGQVVFVERDSLEELVENVEADHDNVFGLVFVAVNVACKCGHSP